ncbi:MAG: hypothetical protein R2827_04190 [Bdellovibrionales bacterium]
MNIIKSMGKVNLFAGIVILFLTSFVYGFEANFNGVLEGFESQIEKVEDSKDNRLIYRCKNFDSDGDTIRYSTADVKNNSSSGADVKCVNQGGSSLIQVKTLRSLKGDKIDENQDYLRVTASRRSGDGATSAVTLVEQNGYSDIIHCEGPPPPGKGLLGIGGAKKVTLTCLPVSRKFCSDNSNSFFRKMVQEKKFPISDSDAERSIRLMQLTTLTETAAEQEARSLRRGMQIYIQQNVELMKTLYPDNSIEVINLRDLTSLTPYYATVEQLPNGPKYTIRSERKSDLEELLRKTARVCHNAYPETMRFNSPNTNTAPATGSDVTR